MSEITINNNTYQIVDANINIVKQDPKQLMQAALLIDCEKVAKEIIEWTIGNVENFIDNHMKIFRLDIALDTNEMPEAKKLQDLYRALPDPLIDIETIKDMPSIDQSIEECRQILDETTDKCYQSMRKSKELLDSLYKRMIFYYEVRCVKDGKAVVMEMEGGVEVLKFEYEAFNVGVEILKGEDKQSVDGALIEKGEKQTLNKYVIPEGFTFWIELVYRHKNKPISLF